MYNRVIVDDSFWTLEDGKEINIALQKVNNRGTRIVGVLRLSLPEAGVNIALQRWFAMEEVRSLVLSLWLLEDKGEG